MAPNCGEGGFGLWPGISGLTVDPQPPQTPLCCLPRAWWVGDTKGDAAFGVPQRHPKHAGKGTGLHPMVSMPTPHEQCHLCITPGAAHPQTPPGAGHTHRQLLVGGHLVRQGPDPLIGAVHPQPGAQPGQLLIAPRVVPARGEEATGTAGHCWAPLGMAMGMGMGTATTCTPYRGR